MIALAGGGGGCWALGVGLFCCLFIIVFGVVGTAFVLLVDIVANIAGIAFVTCDFFY